VLLFRTVCGVRLGVRCQLTPGPLAGTIAGRPLDCQTWRSGGFGWWVFLASLAPFPRKMLRGVTAEKSTAMWGGSQRPPPRFFGRQGSLRMTGGDGGAGTKFGLSIRRFSYQTTRAGGGG